MSHIGLTLILILIVVMIILPILLGGVDAASDDGEDEWPDGD